VVRKFGAVGALTFFHPQLIASPSPAVGYQTDGLDN
jgi:hypothetical protein